MGVDQLFSASSIFTLHIMPLPKPFPPLKAVLRAIADVYPYSQKLYYILNGVMLYLFIYIPVFTIIGTFFKRRFKKARVFHRYAVVIAARNEEPVIGNLVTSVCQQDYPKEMYTTFVIADNCTDNTAEVARKT